MQPFFYKSIRYGLIGVGGCILLGAITFILSLSIHHIQRRWAIKEMNTLPLPPETMLQSTHQEVGLLSPYERDCYLFTGKSFQIHKTLAEVKSFYTHQPEFYNDDRESYYIQQYPNGATLIIDIVFEPDQPNMSNQYYSAPLTRLYEQASTLNDHASTTQFFAYRVTTIESGFNPQCW